MKPINSPFVWIQVTTKKGHPVEWLRTLATELLPKNMLIQTKV
jgi:hypothetical protein